MFPDKCFCTLEQKASRRETERQLGADRKLHGFSVMGADGERVDPLSVRMLMDDA